MSAREIRAWLLRQPRPATLRVRSADGADHELEIGSQSWAQVAESVEALEPEVIEALDTNGKLLRATRPADEAERPTSAPSVPARSVGAVAPEHALFAEFARHLAEAYRHSTEVAFERIVSLFDAMNQRSEAADRARELIYKHQIRDLEERVEAAGGQLPEQSDPLSAMIQAFAGGLFGTGAAAPAPAAPAKANGHSNGSSNGASGAKA